MIRQSDILTYCRTGLTREEIIAVISAITAQMKTDDPACEALDVCNDKLMDLQEAERNSELWATDDSDCKRGQAAQTLGVMA